MWLESLERDTEIGVSVEPGMHRTGEWEGVEGRGGVDLQDPFSSQD